MSNFPFDPDEIAFLMALSEDMNEERSHSWDEDALEKVIDDADDSPSEGSTNVAHQRPFERYIDDVCKGRRSIWDYDKDLPDIVPRVVRSDGSVTRHAIVRYYNLSSWEIYRFEALIEGLDLLNKNGSETPAADVAQLCHDLLNDQHERALSPGQSLLKRIWEDMRVNSDDFQSRKDVLLTLDEGQPGFILHYHIRRESQGN